MSQVQKLFFELNNERNLKEQFLRERNDTLEKYKECQADAIALHKQVGEMQKILDFCESALRDNLKAHQYKNEKALYDSLILIQALKGVTHE